VFSRLAGQLLQRDAGMGLSRFFAGIIAQRWSTKIGQSLLPYISQRSRSLTQKSLQDPVVLAKEQHSNDIATTDKPDQVLKYNGMRVKVKIGD
jgi:hypothetical protein